MSTDNQIGWVRVGVKGEPKPGSDIHGQGSRWFVAECEYASIVPVVIVYDYQQQAQVRDHLKRAADDHNCQAAFYGVVVFDQGREYMTYPNLPSDRLMLYGDADLEPLDWVPLVMSEITRTYDVLMGLDKP